MSGVRRRIVIMDDNAATLELATAILSDAGYDAVPVATLAELTAAVEQTVDLVLMDVSMPEADGDQLAVAMREIRRVAAPILLYSALDEPELAARAREAEVHGYVWKPAGPEEILVKVREALAAD